jgi:List-Bact-rpt repeat protein
MRAPAHQQPLAIALPAAAEYAAAQVTNGGTIKGKITYNGKPPAPKKIAITKDPKICGATRDDDTFVIAADGGVKNVVVYLSDIKSGKKMEGEMKPVLDQHGCHYVPHVQVVPLHSTLQVKSAAGARKPSELEVRHATLTRQVSPAGSPGRRLFRGLTRMPNLLAREADMRPGWLVSIGTALLFACSQGPGGGSGGGGEPPAAGIDGGGPDVGRTDAGVAGSPDAGGSDGSRSDGGGSDGGPVDAGSATHALLLHVNGQGTVAAAGMPDCRDSCTALVPTGSRISLTAAADSGWSFSGWTGDCTGSGSCELLVDRDREATANFNSVPPPPPPPPDECAGLVPPSAPTPHVFTVPPDSYANECAPGTTDGSGTMVLPTLPTGGAPPGTFIFRFVGLDGLVKGSFTDRFDDIYMFDILEQADGYIVARYDNYVPSNKADSVFTVSPTGVKGPPQYPGSSWMIDAVNPVGGAVTALQDPAYSGYEIVSWDEALNRRWTVNTAAEVRSVGVDRKGATLVVVREKADSSNLSAFWIDPSGVAGADFAIGNGATRLIPRVGDGFFVYDYVPPLVTPVIPARGMGTPLAQIDSWATETKAPPAWLAARPHKGLHMVHGGAGYALIDPAGDVAPCSQQIEVLAPSGKSCGTVSFFIGGGACRAGGLTVGYDGTVIQQLPVAMEPVSEIAPGFSEHACTWRYWPGFFR